jgi:hypothetical protein
MKYEESLTYRNHDGAFEIINLKITQIGLAEVVCGVLLKYSTAY